MLHIIITQNYIAPVTSFHAVTTCSCTLVILPNSLTCPVVTHTHTSVHSHAYCGMTTFEVNILIAGFNSQEIPTKCKAAINYLENYRPRMTPGCNYGIEQAA